MLARPADCISVGEVLRAILGPLTTVRGLPADHAEYHGAATHLPKLWQALTAAIESVVDGTTLADLLPTVDVESLSGRWSPGDHSSPVLPEVPRGNAPKRDRYFR